MEHGHYLRPMPIYQMMLTAPDAVTVADSPIYRNPYWPTEPNMLKQRNDRIKNLKVKR